MRQRIHSALPAALGLAVLGGLGPSACGGNPEKKGLAAYEAAVEASMAQDDRVCEELADLRGDLGTGLARKEDQSVYGREQALPFYRRFREASAALRPEAPRLRKVHGVLLEYLDARIGYVEAFDAFLKSSDSEAQRRLEAAQAPLFEAEDALKKEAGPEGVLPEVAQSFLLVRSFVERVYGPFQRGQASVAQVEEALRQHLMPALGRAAEASKGSLTAPGTAGAAARWVKAAREFYQALGQALPQQEALQKSGMATQEKWKQSEDLRERFLADLKSYRESLR
jgi:hypothetical protein